MTKQIKHHLLIVDDEPEVLASLRSMFRRDYKVFTANAAEKAFELLDQQTVHVILSDHRMARMNGTEFLAEVRTRFPDVVRLMITGYADIDSVIDAINRGNVYRYVSKPWEPGELESVVRQAVEQYELVAEKKRLLRELEEANRLKSAFISIASHELNTPLTILLGMLQLAILNNTDATVDDCLQQSLGAAGRLNDFLTNTFKLLHENSSVHLLEREWVPCKELCEQLVRDVELFARSRDQQVAVDVEPEDLRIYISLNQLRDVLVNLLTNAIKFSPDGSTIRLGASRNDGRIEFTVSDRGVGIACEDQPHVFEPFFGGWDTLHHSSGDVGFCKRGMGLGLAVAKRFVQNLGGQIDFESTQGEGTRFRVMFPIDESKERLG